MVYDLIKTGLYVVYTTMLLDKEPTKDNKEKVGIRCVRELYLQLEPETI